MTRAAVAIAVLLSPFVLAAQNSSSNGPTNFGAAGPETPQSKSLAPAPNFFVFSTTRIPDACPISMQANQGVWDHTIRVREGEKEHVVQPFGQKISLTLKDSHPARIQAATVRVTGLTGKNRMVQTGPNTPSADGIRTLRVRFAAQEDGRVAADLWLPGFTAVTSLELREVSYADGSSWKISGSNLCRVQPDPLMLISNR